MPQTTKTSTNAGKSTTKISKANSDNELGVNEPHLNPTISGATFRHKGKMYRYNENEEIVRFYPPDETQPRSRAKLKA